MNPSTSNPFVILRGAKIYWPVPTLNANSKIIQIMLTPKTLFIPMPTVHKRGVLMVMENNRAANLR